MMRRPVHLVHLARAPLPNPPRALGMAAAFMRDAAAFAAVALFVTAIAAWCA